MLKMNFEREIKWFLGPQGPLAELLPNYESRPEQEAMAVAALNTQMTDSILVVEAGTGTGKTFAYLVPALYSARRVVISTGTKALQDQLMNKDLPVLARRFELNVVLVKGRANYLCWKRFVEFSRAPEFRFREEIPVFERIREWAEKTKTGDRAEIPGMPDNYPSWREMSATSEQCLFQKCEFFNECFITRMRAAAQAADIVVVNHHLFFADLAIRTGSPAAALPEYQAVIFDEAHGLAEVAAEYFGVRISSRRINDLVKDLKREQRLGRLSLEELRTVMKAADQAAEHAAAMFAELKEVAPRGQAQEGSRFPLERVSESPDFREAGENLQTRLVLLSRELHSRGESDPVLSNLAERAAILASDLKFILDREDPSYVYWAELGPRGGTLQASPVELGPVLSEALYQKSMPIIFTSATLAVKNGKKWSFEHFKREVGLLDCPRPVKELWLSSSFDFSSQAILYLPDHLPDPNRQDFMDKAAQEMEELVSISKGRAFLLFTSYRNLERAWELLAGRLPYPCLKQGEAPKNELLARFREEEHSVLFATQSFWEGVDVAGPALSCVVIDKLPFAPPEDPMVAARIERLRKAGRNPFTEFQLPAAVIMLKQGLGRLIRSKRDYGILALLDSRVHRKSYGKTFIQSLPPARITKSREDLKRFMTKHEKER